MHQVALYAVDWDNDGRKEEVDVIDPSTGAVLDSQTLSNFAGGEYLVWTLSGHVQIRVTDLAGANAVVSGLFFGAGPAPYDSPTAFLQTNTATQGNWSSTYGSDGYDISQDPSSNNPNLPSYATVTLTGASNYLWAASTTDPRALQVDTDPSDRIASCWYSATSFTIDINITDGLSHQVAIYAVDWDNLGREEEVDVVDPATGAVLQSQTLSNFSGGEYLVWNLSGHVQLRVTNLVAGSNAVVSGLFFGAGAPDPTFLKADATTEGSWLGTYGSDGYDISQDPSSNNPSLPSYATVSLAGELNYTWAASTNDPRALVSADDPASRIASSWYSPTSFTIDINLTDGQVHQVALYALDWDNAGRQEEVDVVDPATGAVLDSETLSNFSGGEYLVWNLSGHVQLRVTNLAGANAVVSGLFFGPGAPDPSFLKTDTSTRGNWQGTYGSDGYDISQDPSGTNPSLPSYATVGLSGESNYTWAASTTDPRALETAAGPASRVAGWWYSATSLTIDIDLTDGRVHQVAAVRPGLGQLRAYRGGRRDRPEHRCCARQPDAVELLRWSVPGLEPERPRAVAGHQPGRGQRRRQRALLRGQHPRSHVPPDRHHHPGELAGHLRLRRLRHQPGPQRQQSQPPLLCDGHPHRCVQLSLGRLDHRSQRPGDRR